jgi:hypothetical protein
MGPRAQFVCRSSACRRQREIEIANDSEGRQISKPRCVCGSEMKRAYSKPEFRELSNAEVIWIFGDSAPSKTWPKAAGRSAHELRLCRFSASRN